MKYVALILSLYIFALNLAPCADYVTSDDTTKTEISQSFGDDDHQHQDSDLCSPFCQCHCCHVHVTYLSAMEYSNVSNPDISTELFHCFVGLERNYTTSILQPPQA